MKTKSGRKKEANNRKIGIRSRTTMNEQTKT